MITSAVRLLLLMLMSSDSGWVWGGAEGVTLGEAGWLDCELVEERIHTGVSGGPETEYVRRKAALLLSNTERDADHRLRDAQKEGIIAFLVTASTVDVARFVEGSTEQLQCEIKRYSTAGIQVDWPGNRGAKAGGEDAWFSCTIRHSAEEFIVTAFLRQNPPSGTPVAQQDYNQFPPITDGDAVHMSVAMVVLTRTPTVDSALLRDVRLDCGFAVDHTRPEVTVEWRVQHRGERLKLFSYASRTGRPETQTPGAAVSLKDIQRGNASLRLTGVQVKSEGTYVCSVYVPPLYGSHDVQLRILESPRVSLNVGTTLELQEEADQKVVCEITGYYPLDVEVEWLRETSGVRMLPTLLKNILYTSHRHNADGTFSISAFFLLRANLPDHGSRYTCRVSHVSLRTPIRKSFTLSVSENTKLGSVLWGLFLCVLIALLALILIVLLRSLHKAWSEAKKRKPY